jgi:hypothetical protein
MWTSLAVAATLGWLPAQPAGNLGLSNDRITYGELGVPRPDNKYLPGDVFFIAFDINNLKLDENGKAQIRMEMNITDAGGKSVFKQPPVDRDEFLLLGGNTLPAQAFVAILLDQTPGTYACKVTVTDRGSMQTASLEKRFEVLPKDFGLVQIFTAHDEAGMFTAPPLGVNGSLLWVHFSVVGFKRDDKTKQPDVLIEMQLTDEAGRPTLPKPTALPFKQLTDEAASLERFRLLLRLNRAGKFHIHLTATDKLANKTSKITLPITVLPAPTGQ